MRMRLETIRSVTVTALFCGVVGLAAGASPSLVMAVPARATTANVAFVDVCSLLSAAKVSSLTGRTYSAGTPNTIAPGVESCVYAATEGYSLSVTIYSAPNRSTLASLVFDIGGAKSATAVQGVGDQAFASPVGLVAKFQSHLLEVASPATTGSSKAVIPGYVAVAKAVIAAASK